MSDEAKANKLPQLLADELAALAPFESYGTAVTAINGGMSPGIKTKYQNELSQCAGLSDPLRASIGAAINDQCDSIIALLAPVQCAETGWTSYSKPKGI